MIRVDNDKLRNENSNHPSSIHLIVTNRKYTYLISIRLSIKKFIIFTITIEINKLGNIKCVVGLMYKSKQIDE